MATHFIPGYSAAQGTKPLIDSHVTCTLLSKKRLCQQCYKIERQRADERLRKKMLIDEKEALIERDLVDSENQRRSTPINSDTTDVERYIISLPDRSKVQEKYYDVNTLEHYFNYLENNLDIIFSAEEANALADRLMVDGDYIDRVREHIRSFFIKDENRIFPNDPELTDFMQRYHNSLHKISYCKYSS